MHKPQNSNGRICRILLTPGEGIDVKLAMEEWAEIELFWVAKYYVSNFDL